LKKKVFLNSAKFLGLYNNVIFHATNADEAESIKQVLSKKSTIKIAPNLPEKSNFDFVKRGKNIELLKLVSIARISIEKNTKFALEQLLNITEHKIVFDLYGSIYDKNYWNECEEIIERLPENIQVNYKGTVEKSLVKQTFAKYHISFMPSKGENFGHSILESFMSGTSVITSTNTPWKELEKKNIGWDIDLNNTSKFEEVINNCAELSQEDYDEMSKNAFNFAQEFANNPELVEKTKNLFE
jgi:glycosyltransferase involved in cell wall biosynthesis